MKKRIFNIISTVILCVFSICGYFYIYKNYHISIPCIFHEITGLYCPGCGITRSLYALLQGHIYESFMYNQIGFILLPFIITYYSINTYYYITGKERKLIKKIPNYIYISVLIIVILFGIIRNIPAFSILRP